MKPEHQPSLVLLMQAKNVLQLFLALLMPKAKLWTGKYCEIYLYARVICAFRGESHTQKKHSMCLLCMWMKKMTVQHSHETGEIWPVGRRTYELGNRTS